MANLFRASIIINCKQAKCWDGKKRKKIKSEMDCKFRARFDKKNLKKEYIDYILLTTNE